MSVIFASLIPDDEPEDTTTDRFRAFKDALAGLCLEHSVGLRTEGALFVIDGNRCNGVLFHAADFKDCTREQPYLQDH